MKIKYFCCCLLPGFFSGLQAQVSGIVVDSLDQPIPYVNAILYSASDSTLITGAITDTAGTFAISPNRRGTYFVELKSLGFASLYTPPFSLHTGPMALNLGTLVLAEGRNTLDEVVVEARRNLVQRTPEGQVINVQSSMMTQGSNALQVLERLPGVLPDRRNNQFSMNGQSGVTVMFNGRKMPLSMEEVMSLLESTMADQIEKIELITAPSARYDSDGGAGIINIVFAQNEYEGSRLQLNTSAGYGYGEKLGSSLSYSRGKGAWTVNGSYSFSQDRGKNGFEGNGTSNIPVLGAPGMTFFSTYFNRNDHAHNVNLGSTYQLSRNSELGGEVFYSLARNESLSNVNNFRAIEGQDDFKEHLLTDGTARKDNLIASLYLGTSLSEQSRLHLDFSYLDYSNNNPAVTTSRYANEEDEPVMPDNPIFTDGNRSTSVSAIRVGVFKADFSSAISDRIQGEFGTKGSYAVNTNDSKVEFNNNGEWETDPRSQSGISGIETLWAAYSQFKFRLEGKTELDLGLRYEYWARTLSTRGSPLIEGHLFPSLSYRYALSDTRSVQLGYQNRISRPAYSDLVTNLYYNDPTAIFTGNPLLNPTLTQTVQLEYTQGGFHAGISLQEERDPIIRYQLTGTPQNDILVISPQNADCQKSVNLFLTLPFSWASWARLNLSTVTALRKYRISYSPNPAEKSYLFQSLNATQNFRLPWNMEMELSGWYNFDHFNGTNKTYGFGVLNFGLSKKFGDRGGTLLLAVSDVLQSFRVHTHISDVTPIVFDINTVSDYRGESAFSPIIRLSFSRSFGQMSSSKTRDFRNKEELERVN